MLKAGEDHVQNEMSQMQHIRCSKTCEPDRLTDDHLSPAMDQRTERPLSIQDHEDHFRVGLILVFMSSQHRRR
jgi:hypothetical protein